MKIVMMGNKIAVQKIRKQKDSSSFIVEPVPIDAIGTIMCVGPDVKCDQIKVGATVIFGSNRFSARIPGADIEVMDEENIYAVMHEEEK